MTREDEGSTKGGRSWVSKAGMVFGALLILAGGFISLAPEHVPQALQDPSFVGLLWPLGLALVALGAFMFALAQSMVPIR